VLTPGRTTLDLAKPNEIAAVLDRLAPELILNSSAYTAVDQAEDERDLAFIINGESPGFIARWAAARRVPLIHVSTDDVFDGSGTRPWKEGDLSKASVGLPRRKQACRGGCRARRRGPAPRCAAWISFLSTIARLAE
jgi:dTDP-4-dehydrorhamnose reductase